MNLKDILIEILISAIVLMIVILAIWVIITHMSEPFKACEKQNWTGFYFEKQEGNRFDCTELYHANFVEVAR